MPLDLALEPGLVLWVAGFLVQTALAVWVFAIAPRDPRHAAFAFLLAANAAWDLVGGGLVHVSQSTVSTYFLDRLTFYFVLLSAAGLLAFASVYPRRRLLASTRWGLPALALATLVALVVYAAVPALSWTPDLARPPDGNPTVFGALGFGPLMLALLLWAPLLAIVAGDIVLTQARRPGEMRDVSQLLVVASFLVYPFLDLGGLLAQSYTLDPFAMNGLDGAVYYALWATAGLVSAVLAPIVLFGLLVVAAGHPTQGRRIAAIAGLVSLVAFLGGVSGAYSGLASLMFGGLVAYALARHKLFDIDVKLRWGLSRGTVAAAFVGVAFVSAEATANVLSAEYGALAGGVAAGALLLALAPLQRVAERLAAAALPKREGGNAADAEATYRRALRLALRDRILTREEERELTILAHDLGLAPARAFALRDEVEVLGRPSSSDPIV